METRVRGNGRISVQTEFGRRRGGQVSDAALNAFSCLRVGHYRCCPHRNLNDRNCCVQLRSPPAWPAGQSICRACPGFMAKCGRHEGRNVDVSKSEHFTVPYWGYEYTTEAEAMVGNKRRVTYLNTRTCAFVTMGVALKSTFPPFSEHLCPLHK